MGASEGGASYDSLYGDVLRPLVVFPRLVPAGTRVAAPEPAVEAEPPEASSIASWATTRTTPRTSSPSLASATGCRGARRGKGRRNGCHLVAERVLRSA